MIYGVFVLSQVCMWECYEILRIFGSFSGWFCGSFSHEQGHEFRWIFSIRGDLRKMFSLPWENVAIYEPVGKSNSSKMIRTLFGSTPSLKNFGKFMLLIPANPYHSWKWLRWMAI